MAKLQRSAGAVVFLAFLLSAALVGPAYAGGAPGAFPLGWISGCRGSIAECLAGDEFDLGSEVSRRILSTAGYISYGALRRDTTPAPDAVPPTTTAAPAPRPTPTRAAAPPSASAGDEGETPRSLLRSGKEGFLWKKN